MSSNSSFVLNHMTIMSDMSKSGLLDSEESSFKAACDYYFEKIPMSDLFRKILEERDEGKIYNAIVFIALSDLDYGRQLIDLARMHCSDIALYNKCISFIDSSPVSVGSGDEGLILNRVPGEDLLSNLRTLAHSINLDINSVKWSLNKDASSILLKNLFCCGYSPNLVMSRMSSKEILAASSAIKEFGFDVLPKEAEAEYESRFRGEMSFENTKPLYNFMKFLHGAYKAQVIIENELPPYDKKVFLNKEDVLFMIKGDSLKEGLSGFFKENPFKKGDNYKLIDRVVGAFRNSGCIGELDSVQSRIIVKLFAAGILCEDDVEKLPSSKHALQGEMMRRDFSI